ncbi:MAG: site-specific integrase [Halopseudomonas sp.]
MARRVRHVLNHTGSTTLSLSHVKATALEWQHQQTTELGSNSPLTLDTLLIPPQSAQDERTGKAQHIDPVENKYCQRCCETDRNDPAPPKPIDGTEHTKPGEFIDLPTALKPEPKTATDLAVSEVFEKFAAERVASGAWTMQRSRQAFTNAIQVFTSLVGDQPIQDFTKATGRGYKELLQRYPKNLTKTKQFRGMTALEVISSDMDYQPISFKTVSDQIGHISSLLRWAVNQGYIDQNPMEGLKPRVKKSSGRDDRKSFTPADLKLLLSTPIHTELKMLHPYHYWLPLMALYTGARLEELCQLYTSNVKTIDGIPCFFIDDSKPNQHLKNAESRRLIPIHQQLLDLGFIGFVRSRQDEVGDNLLFTGLKPINEKFGHSASKWFGRLKTQLGLEGGKVFHSFRHTMTDALRATRSNDYEIKRILGHTTGSETHDRYGSNSNVLILNKVVQSVLHPEIHCIKPAGNYY